MTLDEDAVGPRQRDRRKVRVGRITLPDAGRHWLKVVPRRIVKTQMIGLTLLGAALNRS